MVVPILCVRNLVNSEDGETQAKESQDLTIIANDSRRLVWIGR